MKSLDRRIRVVETVGVQRFSFGGVLVEFTLSTRGMVPSALQRPCSHHHGGKICNSRFVRRIRQKLASANFYPGSLSKNPKGLPAMLHKAADSLDGLGD